MPAAPAPIAPAPKQAANAGRYGSTLVVLFPRMASLHGSALQNKPGQERLE